MPLLTLTNPALQYDPGTADPSTGMPLDHPLTKFFKNPLLRNQAIVNDVHAGLNSDPITTSPVTATAGAPVPEGQAPDIKFSGGEPQLSSPTLPKEVQPSLAQVSKDPITGLTKPVNDGETKLGKLVHILGAAAVGALNGSSQGSFGAGAQAAQQIPVQQAIQRQGLQGEVLQNQKTVASIPFLRAIQAANLSKLQSEVGRDNATAEREKAVAASIPTKTEQSQQKIDQASTISNRKQGLDENGDPLAYEDLTPTEQASFDLKTSQRDAKQAQADLTKAKNDPNSPIYKEALVRLRTAQQNAATAAGRLGIQRGKFNADYLGIGPDGKPLAGAGTDDAGNPVGIAVTKANAATSDRLKRSDLARNVQTNTQEMRGIIQRRPDLFGKIAGRYTTFQQMIGSDDPDIVAMGVHGHNTALASNGAHGLRSQEAIAETEKRMLNGFRNGPQATLAGLDALDQSVGTFIKDAKLGKKAGEAPSVPTGNDFFSKFGGKGRTK